MRARLQKSLSVMLCVTLLLSYAIFVFMVYREDVHTMREEVQQEAIYVSQGMNQGAVDYITSIGDMPGNTRFTLVSHDGTVTYDSNHNAKQMDNHSKRKEIINALAQGSGSATRMSSTLGKMTYYYAVRLDNGDVLRVSKTMDSVLDTVLVLLPTMMIVAVLMMVLAIVLAAWQTKRMIKPINELDIENPLENEIYDELKPLLVSMEESNQQKELSTKMRKEFSANVSHELKTPLTSILGYAELMMNNMVRPEDIPRFSEKVHTEASRLLALVDDIIKLSKLDEESVQLEIEDVELYSMTRDIASRLAFQTEKRNVNLEVTGEPVTMKGIRQVLDEMIYNIAENAIKYNVDGGKVTIWTGTTLDGAKVVVSDTGIGIPKAEQERIFERFYRIDKSHSKEIGGTGLGLSIAKHGALLHHATVSVDSEMGIGTRIEVEFPTQP